MAATLVVILLGKAIVKAIAIAIVIITKIVVIIAIRKAILF